VVCPVRNYPESVTLLDLVSGIGLVLAAEMKMMSWHNDSPGGCAGEPAMLSLPVAVRIFAFTGVADMRKSFDLLS
jgi:hypothetical protein